MGPQKPKIISNTERSKSPIIAQDRSHLPLERPSRIETRVDTRPCFASSWIETPEISAEEILARYSISGVRVLVAAPRNASYGIYAVDPPEYHLGHHQLQIMADALEDLTDSIPAGIETRSLTLARPYIKGKAKSRIYADLASGKDPRVSGSELEKDADRLSELLCKYTAGFGTMETLLEDSTVQDIYIDAPSSQIPIHVVLRSDAIEGVRQKCRTNIFVGRRDLQGFVSRVKFETGLPFSEAHPVLEADMRMLDSRVTLVGPPLSEKGVSVAIRKHSRGIWTMPALIANGSISPLLSSFLWACVIGRRTVLIAGSRGAGKTTLLGAMLLEFPLSQRIILIEDTPEIPSSRMQSIGYDMQSLRFSSDTEPGSVSAEESLRVSLRMGESAIVIGEVRGREAKVLYESMRAGSAGSAVLGTIHGNSAKGVLDRAVEDLGVTERAFSSTDLVAVIGLVRSPDGSRFCRRVTEVAEVRWTGSRAELVNLFATEPGCMCAKPTPDFSAQSRTIGGVASALGMRTDETMEIIKARAHADQVASEDPRSRCHGTKENGDRFRVLSNEVLMRALFTAVETETALREWRTWFDESDAR